jgi:hypothetical protein
MLKEIGNYWYSSQSVQYSQTNKLDTLNGGNKI